jgi:ATP-dependent DNA ligase
VSLALRPPFAPMEALSVAEIPKGDCWQYEPKWDGFRCLVFRDEGKIELQSKSGRMLTRYFPELVAALLEIRAKRFVLDGEIMVPHDGAFSFDALLQRIHPASSRVRHLAKETPAQMIVFDLLAGPDGGSLVELPLRERRNKTASPVHHGAGRAEESGLGQVSALSGAKLKTRSFRARATRCVPRRSERSRPPYVA